MCIEIIEIPEFAVVAMVGPTSSGKSTFARKNFPATEILSSDFFRAMVADDENDQTATKDAFDILFHAADRRLRRGKRVVVDATNVQPHARYKILALARRHGAPAVAVVLDLPEKILLDRNSARLERNYPASVIQRHLSELHSDLCSDTGTGGPERGPEIFDLDLLNLKEALRKKLKGEGFTSVYVLGSQEEAAAGIKTVPLRPRTQHDEHRKFENFKSHKNSGRRNRFRGS